MAKTPRHLQQGILDKLWSEYSKAARSGELTTAEELQLRIGLYTLEALWERGHG